jgi:hypothetical protein
MGLKRDHELDELASKKDSDQLSEEADSGCTSGYDNDGSTGYEIFENGFDLAQKAGKKTVFAVFADDDESVFFFIGTKKSVLRRIQKLASKMED